MSDRSIISEHQWDFMSNRSTTSALCLITHNWFRALDDGNEVCSVFFDLRKAFDSVPHAPLLDRLLSYNIDPTIIAWIHSYLACRSQTVVIGGEQSACLPVVSGVPQGSVLGPLLFIIYINEITSTISPHSRISMFADDIALYCSISVFSDYERFQRDISAVVEWVVHNYLAFNEGKCSSMFISRKTVHSNPPPPLFVGNSVLTSVDTVKYLGVTLSSDMSWSPHINKINTKARRLIGLFYRRFYFCSPSTLVTFYTSFIRPLLEYASAVWDPYLCKDIDLLEKTQTFALRICLKNWSLSSDNLLSQLNLSALADRRLISKLCHLFKIIKNYEDFRSPPISFKSQPYNSRHLNSLALCPIFAHSSQFYFSFFPHTISNWNSLSNNTVNLSSLSLFKKLLKSHN